MGMGRTGGERGKWGEINSSSEWKKNEAAVYETGT